MAMKEQLKQIFQNRYFKHLLLLLSAIIIFLIYDEARYRTGAIIVFFLGGLYGYYIKGKTKVN